jgi:hypothetical protein
MLVFLTKLSRHHSFKCPCLVLCMIYCRPRWGYHGFPYVLRGKYFDITLNCTTDSSCRCFCSSSCCYGLLHSQQLTASIKISHKKVHTFIFIQNEETVNGSGLDTRSWWPCSLRLQSTATWFLLSWVRIPVWARIFPSCVCCLDSVICDQIIICLKESYRECLCKTLQTSTISWPKTQEKMA